MKREMTVRTLGIIAPLLLSIPCNGLSAEQGRNSQRIRLSVSSDLVSKYYWRGFDTLDGRSAVQPSVGILHQPSGLWVNLWGSLALADRDVTRRSDELDLTFGMDRTLGESVDLTVGAILYFYPRVDPSRDFSEEVFAGITFSTLPLQPTITYFHDFSLGDGGYLLVGGTHSFEDLDVMVNTGFSLDQYTTRKGFTDLVLGAAYNVRLGSRGFLRPNINLGLVADRERNPDRAEFWVGLTVGWDR